MLPNIYIPPYKLFGFLPIHPFGVLVALAVIVGFQLGRRRAKQTGLDPDICADGMFWMVVTAFVVAHWVSDILYYPEEVVKNPFTLLAFWRGLSSFGGFIGAFLGAFIYFRRKKVSFVRYGEAIFFGFVPGWIIGRLGCTIVFDHPGRPTDFFLGMADLSGVVRHNLGLYEMLLALILTVILYGIKKLRPFDGFHIAVVMLIYSPLRFCLDSLRVADRTYLGFTPGQYFSILMMVLSAYMIINGFRKEKLSREKPVED